MIATLLLLLAVLTGSPAPASSTPPRVTRAAPVLAAGAPVAPATAVLPPWSDDPAIAASPVITNQVFLPFVVAQPSGCEAIPGMLYGTFDVEDPATSPPAEQHADLNLSLRGYEATDAYHGLVDYGGPADAKAPQLYTLFANRRVPAFPTVYQVYHWDWPCKCRSDLLTNWEVTLAGMGVAPGEVLSLPDSGYTIGNGYEALVLYATEERITLKYTGDDDVVEGYTIHVENICVEPSLLDLYRAWNDAGRDELPALHGGQPFGRARGYEIGLAIRDWGTFMDPRSRKDWWQGK